MRVLRPAALLLTAVLTSLALMLSATPAQADPGNYDHHDDFPTYNSLFYKGPGIGHFADYVSQGIAYWKAQDSFVMTYYNKDESKTSGISIVSRSTGTHWKHFDIASGHVGEAAISQGYLWVSDYRGGKSWVRRYSLSRLTSAKDGAYLAADKPYFAVNASASITAANGDLYVGTHTKKLGTEGYLYRYDVSKAGNVGAKPISTSRIAGEVQGIEFSGRYTFYSQSWGRREKSRIKVVDRSTGRSAYVSAPSMSEGITIVAGRLYVTYESGASVYRGHLNPLSNSKNPIYSVHYASTSSLIARL